MARRRGYIQQSRLPSNPKHIEKPSTSTNVVQETVGNRNSDSGQAQRPLADAFVGHLQDAILSKCDSANTLYNLRRLEKRFSQNIEGSRRRYPIRQPIYQLEFTGKEIVYLTGRKTGRTVFFKLDETNKYELLNVEPDYITVYSHIFGSQTSLLMKHSSPGTVTNQRKNLCRFVMNQFGLNLDAEENVMENCEVPKYASGLDFGANRLPVKLFHKYLKKWRNEQTYLSKLQVSFKVKLESKQEMAADLLDGFTFEQIWSPENHDESLFCGADLLDYEKRLRKKYSLSLRDNPLLIYAALSDDGEKMAILCIADHAVRLNCYLFMELTESDENHCVSDRRLTEMLHRLRN